ncbi:MAG TPA: DUF2092 domain-containing protein [Verrucomicrobiae bacterium]|nr:DUF2092 domain-containing protein [Verrucomicrobiae bacterium]
MRNRNPFLTPTRNKLGLPLVLLGFAALTACAAEVKPAVDAHADEMLRRMGEYLSQAQFFSVNVEIWQDVELASGQRVQAGRTAELKVRRPDRFRAEIHSAHRNRELVYDGSAITLFNSIQNFYGTVPTSGSLDKMMDVACERFGITLPLEDFIRTDPHRDFLQKVISGHDLGTVNVMGTLCDHLGFSQENIDWQVWIEAGVKPIPRKFVITYKDEPGAPQFIAIFSHWDFETKLPDFVFKFEPPPGSSKIKVKEIRAENQSRKKEEQ